MKLQRLLYSTLGMFLIAGCGGKTMNTIPDNADASASYIFYLHGSAEEEQGSTDKYRTAVQAIASGSAKVISEVRGYTEPNEYAKEIKKQVNQLIAKGVPAKNITVSGFSKGAIISLAVAGAVNNAAVNYVLLAGCSEDLNNKYSVETDNVAGRILSIYDEDDEKFGSCDGVIKTSGNSKFKEIELGSGKGHKLFRIPKEKFIEQWRDPLLEWAGA